MLLAAAAVVAMTADRWLGDAGPAGADRLGRGDGVVLLLLFGVFVYYTVRDVLGVPRDRRLADPFVGEVAAGTADLTKPRPTWVYLAMTAVGLAGVAGGGRLTVLGAVEVAGRLGVPEAVVGLTVVSFGTTLPELTTGLLAARRGEGDIAVGNVVGSNIFNLLFVGGLASVIRPVPVPAGGHADLVVMAGLSLLLLPIAIRGPRRVTRAEGAFLLVAYLSYAAYRVASST